MKKDELRALAQRVMALAGPSGLTDEDIARATGWKTVCMGVEQRVGWRSPEGKERYSIPAFTASLDAAMAMGRQFLLVAMSDIAADGLAGVCLCSDTSTSPPKEHWGIAFGGAAGLREQVLARCYTAAALLALAEQVPE